MQIDIKPEFPIDKSVSSPRTSAQKKTSIELPGVSKSSRMKDKELQEAEKEEQTKLQKELEQAKNHNAEARELAEKGYLDTALQKYKISLQIFLSTVGPRNINTAILLTNIGQLYEKQREYEKALGVYKQHQMILNHLIPTADARHAYNLHNISNAHMGLQQYQEARDILADAIKIMKEAKTPQEIRYLADLHNSLGLAFLKMKNYKEAKKDFVQSLELLGEIKVVDLIRQGEGCANKGHAHKGLGEFNNAINSYRQTIKYYEGGYEGLNERIARMHTFIGEIFYLKGYYGEAANAYEEAEDIYSKIQKEEEPLLERASNLQFMAKAQYKGKQYFNCIRNLNEAIKIKADYHDPTHIDLAYLYRKLAEAQNQVQKQDEACESLIMSIKLYQKNGKGKSMAISHAMQLLGEIYMLQDKKIMAKDILKGVHSIQCAKLGENHEQAQRTKRLLGQITRYTIIEELAK